MNILRSIVIVIMVISIVTVLSGRTEAAQMVNIVATGASSYSVVATDLQDSAGIDLTITYDDALLGSPVVKAGTLTSNAIMDFNSSNPPRIRVVFITSGVIKGTGELASLSFKAKGSNAPIPVISGIGVYNVNGSQVAVQTASSVLSSEVSGESVNSTASASNTKSSSTSSSTSSSATGSVAGQSVTTIGSISLSQDTPVTNLEPVTSRSSRRDAPVVTEVLPRVQPVEIATATAVNEAKATNTAPVTPVEVRHSKNIQAVLERFRIHKEARSLKQFMTLFDESAAKDNNIVQLPAIVVSDGKSLIKVIIDLGQESESPSFSLKGANQKSLHRLSDKRWELEALPQKGKTDVRVSVIVHGSRIEIPLTVVPPLTALGHEILALDEAKLEIMIANPLKNNKPAYDMNGDGKQDYLDDYILTAHWLLKKQLKSKKNVQKPTVPGK